MGLNSNRGSSQERRAYYMIQQLKRNISFLTENDFQVLEWMGKKGDFPEKTLTLGKKS